MALSQSQAREIEDEDENAVMVAQPNDESILKKMSHRLKRSWIIVLFILSITFLVLAEIKSCPSPQNQQKSQTSTDTIEDQIDSGIQTIPPVIQIPPEVNPQPEKVQPVPTNKVHGESISYVESFRVKPKDMLPTVTIDKLESKNGSPHYLEQKTGKEQIENIVSQELSRRQKSQLFLSSKYSQWQNQEKSRLFAQYKPIPKLTQRTITIGIIINQQKTSNHCGVMNALNIVTPLTMTAIESLVQKHLHKVVIFLDSSNQLSIEELHNKFTSNIHFKYIGLPDSEYLNLNMAVEGCSNLIYLQNNFIINAEILIEKAKLLPPFHLAYSQKVFFQGNQRALKNLQITDLASLSQEDLGQYVFIFDSKFLRYITPLNFAYFSKFILEEIIILPLLALLQKSDRIDGFQSLGHSFEEDHIQFKEFPLNNVKENKVHLCFVGYPSNPFSLDEKEVSEFAQSLKMMKKKQTASSVVVSAPYSFESSFSIWDSFKHIIQLDNKFGAIRLRIWGQKSVSSLAVYEAAFTYCPTKAIIASSRFNIRYHPNFYQSITSRIQESYHYYVTKFTNQNSKQVDFDEVRRYTEGMRTQALYFRSHFQYVQIFKSDLLKMHYMHILKCDELDFYETQASFVIPMMETIRLKILRIPQNLFAVSKRQRTSLEDRQVVNIGKYWSWQGMRSVILKPRTYNSLMNQAFRRNAPQKIQKNIHQLWLSKQAASPIRQRLHQTLKEKNPDFKMHLWTFQNITRENFPITHPIIQNVLDREKYQKSSSKSAISDLVRYEAVYNKGGMYFDFKVEGLKSLVPFLKYELFFADCDYDNFYQNPRYVGSGLMGATMQNYHMRYVLMRFVSVDTYDFANRKFPVMIGGFLPRHAFTDEQLYTIPGFGFQLISPRPTAGGKAHLQCQLQTTFTQDQKVFEVVDKNGKLYKIGIPCSQYPETFVMIYKTLAGTWKSGSKKVN